MYVLLIYDWSSFVTKWYIHVRYISNSYRFLQVHFVFLNTLGIISSYLKIDLFVYSDTHTTSTTSTKFVDSINPDSFWGKLDLCYYIFLQCYKVPMSKIWMYLFYLFVCLSQTALLRSKCIQFTLSILNITHKHTISFIFGSSCKFSFFHWRR